MVKFFNFPMKESVELIEVPTFAEAFNLYSAYRFVHMEHKHLAIKAKGFYFTCMLCNYKMKNEFVRTRVVDL